MRKRERQESFTSEALAKLEAKFSYASNVDLAKANQNQRVRLGLEKPIFARREKAVDERYIREIQRLARMGVYVR